MRVQLAVALAVLASATPASPARAAQVTGAVVCADCGPVAVLAEVPAAGLSVTVGLPGPGSFAIVVGEATGDLYVAAFRDADEDGAPDPGTALVDFAGNPVALTGADVTGLLLELPPLDPPPTALLSGAVTCASCPGAVAVTVAGLDAPFSATVALPGPGPWALAVPAGLGAVEVHAFSDADEDGAPDAGGEPVPFPGNPVTVADGPVPGLDLDLDAGVGPGPVTLSGTVACGDCPGGVGVVVAALDGGYAVTAGLDAPGPWSLAVPPDLGAVEVHAFRDADGDGAPDPGTDALPYAGNPLTVAGADVAGLDVDLGTLPEPGAVVLSGTVTCEDCGGGVAVAVVAAAGSPAWTLGLPAPGAWSLAVPADLGPVDVSAFRDADEDGAPDPGAPPVAHVGNPVTVGADDVSGLDVDLGALAPPGVTLSGTVLCADCAGPVGVALEAADGAFGLTLGLAGPGPWAAVVPAALGPVDVSAFRDGAGDGSPDPGTEAVPYPGNPVLVGTADLAGIDLDLGALPVPDSVTLSGAVTCGDCPGAVAVTVTAVDGGFAVTLGLDGPGPWTLAVPSALGPVALEAFRDADEDGAPDPGTEAVPFAGNPVTVGLADLSGLDVDLGGPPVADEVTLSGTVLCATCPGPVAVTVAAVEGGYALTLALAGPGPWAAAVPAQLGPVEVAAFRDADEDAVPDGGAAPVPYPGNPVSVGDQDVPGIVLDLDAPPVDPEPADEASDAGDASPDALEDAAGDLGPADTGPADVPGDEGPADTGPADVPGDEGPLDTAPADVPGDEGPADTGPADVPGDEGPADTGPADVPGDEGPADTGPADVPGDEGPADTAGPDGDPFDSVLPDTGPADTPAPDGPAPDAAPDAAGGDADAPAGAEEGEPAKKTGCGCRAGTPPPAGEVAADLLATALILLFLLAARRRRRPVADPR